MFAELARGRITRTRAALEELASDPSSPNAIEVVTRELHTLKGEAQLMKQTEVAALAGEMEQRFRSGDAFLTQLARVEQMVAAIAQME